MPWCISLLSPIDISKSIFGIFFFRFSTHRLFINDIWRTNAPIIFSKSALQTHRAISNTIQHHLHTVSDRLSLQQHNLVPATSSRHYYTQIPIHRATHSLILAYIHTIVHLSHMRTHDWAHTHTNARTLSCSLVSELMVFLSFSFTHLIRLIYTPVPKIKAETCTIFSHRSDSDCSPYFSSFSFAHSRAHKHTLLKMILSNMIPSRQNCSILSVLQPIRRQSSFLTCSSNVLCILKHSSAMHYTWPKFRLIFTIWLSVGLPLSLSRFLFIFHVWTARGSELQNPDMWVYLCGAYGADQTALLDFWDKWYTCAPLWNNGNTFFHRFIMFFIVQEKKTQY